MQRDLECITCNVCQKEFSCTTSTSSLAKHLRNHGIEKEANKPAFYDGALETEDLSEFVQMGTPLMDIVMKYMESGKESINCSVCKYDFSQNSSAVTLCGHLESFHGLPRTRPKAGDNLRTKFEDPGPILADLSSEVESGSSAVWKYMTKDDEYATCMICQRKFSRKTSTTSLSRHLLSLHGVTTFNDK